LAEERVSRRDEVFNQASQRRAMKSRPINVVAYHSESVDAYWIADLRRRAARPRPRAWWSVILVRGTRNLRPTVKKNWEKFRCDWRGGGECCYN